MSSGDSAAARPGRGCRRGPNGEKLEGPALRRGMQWTRAAVEKAELLLKSFMEAPNRGALPKEKTLRDHIALLQAKTTQLGQVSLGFGEDTHPSSALNTITNRALNLTRCPFKKQEIEVKKFMKSA